MSNDTPFLAGFLNFVFGLLFLALIISAFIFAAFIVIPLIVIAVIGFAGYRAYVNSKNSPARLQERAHQQTLELIHAATGKNNSDVPTSKAIAEEILRNYAHLHPSAQSVIGNFIEELYEHEIVLPIENIPDNPNSLEGIRYRDNLRRVKKNQEQIGQTVDAFRQTIEASLDALLIHAPALSNEGPTVPLSSLLTEARGAVHNVALPFYNLNIPDDYINDQYLRDAKKRGLFKSLVAQIDRNLVTISMAELNRTKVQAGERVYPDSYEGDDVRAYVRGTLLERLFDLPVVAPQLQIPADVRFEHTWICAGSGHGKTQALLNMIWDDLDDVANMQKSVVVIDSQGDLINTLSHLRRFGDGGDLDGRLVLIDPTDIEYPVQLNLFSLSEDIESYEPLEREKLQNAAIELYEFILGSLLGAELTSKQSTMFRYALRAMLVIPGATIHTFRELFEPGGYEKYKEHIEKLTPSARAFFATEFTSREFEATNRQIVRRLWAVLESGVFERMFSHSKSKFNMFREMNSGKVILINTAKDLLKQSGTEIFGRFFIALLAQAAQERAVLPKNERLPTHVYIDESAEYLDENVSLILEQSRKYNVGITLATQYIGQLSPKLFDSFAANTAMKFVGGVSSKDARAFAQMMNCEPEFIQQQPKGSFAMHVRNYTSIPQTFAFPIGFVEQQEQMSPRRFEAIRALNRQRYAIHVNDLDRPEDPKPPRSGPDDMDTSPSPQW